MESVTSDCLAVAGFDNLRDWERDDHAAAMAAFLASARRMQEKPYKTGSLGIESGRLRAIAARALEDAGALSSNADAARLFFEENFLPHRLLPPSGAKQGFVTGFFEPLVEASPVKTGEFRFPLLARPDDLVAVSDANRTGDLEPGMRFARQTTVGLAPYFDRGEIERGALTGRGLELAWLRDPVDVFFIHIQGAVKLKMTDGTERRLTYAAKTGHSYTSLGKVLRERLGCEPGDMTADVLAAWMRDLHERDPEAFRQFTAQNRSYIFFQESEGSAGGVGPIAAAKVPLVPWRSLAVDRLLHTFGTPVHVATAAPLPEQDGAFSQLMIAHDTGSAIVGAARGDIFTGTGESAGRIAGRIQHAADMAVLVPREPE